MALFSLILAGMMSMLLVESGRSTLESRQRPHSIIERYDLTLNIFGSVCMFSTLVPEVFLDFSSRKRSRASREAATTCRESDEEREKNLWLPWPRISLSCRRQGQDLTLGRSLVDIFSNTQTNLIGSFNCNYRGDAEDCLYAALAITFARDQGT